MLKIATKLLSAVAIVLFIGGCSSGVKKDVENPPLRNTQVAVKVYFAGFSLSGDAASSKANFPHSFPLTQEKNDRGLSIIDQAAQDAIKTVHSPYLDIVTNLSDYKNDNVVATAVVLDSEDVSQESINGVVKVVVTLRGQIVAFNFKEMKVIGSYPLSAELIDAPKKKLNDQELAILVKELYLTANKSFIKEIVGRFNQIIINTGDTRKIQIKSVTSTDEYIKLIKKENQSTTDINTLIARNFEKYLSKNQNVAMLPFKKDQSVGGRLPIAFSNGDVFNLEIPSPDFVISLSLKKLIKAKLGANEVEDAYTYVSIVNIKAEQPEMGSTSIDVDVRYALPVTVSKSIKNIDDRSHFVESIIQLFNTFTQQITKPESEWLDTWVESSRKDIEEQFVKFLEVINKCK